MAGSIAQDNGVNAGFCCGQMLGFDLEASLQLGVGTSGYYLRNAESPTQTQLVEFLDSIGGHA